MHTNIFRLLDEKYENQTVYLWKSDTVWHLGYECYGALAVIFEAGTLWELEIQVAGYYHKKENK